MLWGERFADGADKVTVNLGARYATVKVYDPTTGASPTQSLTDIGSLALTLSDHPVIIELAASETRSVTQDHGRTKRRC